MSQMVEFSIPQYTMLSEGEFAVMDAVCNITTLLVSMDLEYKTHWQLHSSYYGHDGDRIIMIEFFDPSDAMLAKIRGLSNG